MRHHPSFALALLLGACWPAPAPPPVDTTDAQVCARLERLGCAAARPTADGATCVDVMRGMADAGVPLGEVLECVQAATTCAAATTC